MGEQFYAVCSKVVADTFEAKGENCVEVANMFMQVNVLLTLGHLQIWRKVGGTCPRCEMISEEDTYIYLGQIAAQLSSLTFYGQTNS